MVKVRSDNSMHHAAHPRFNVLLTQDRPRGDEAWFAQLPRLLEPQGVRAFVARSGREAITLAEAQAIHAAVIDLGTPPALDEEPGAGSGDRTWPGPGDRAEDRSGSTPRRPTSRLSRTIGRAVGGRQFTGRELWLLELFDRLPNKPPIIVVRPPEPNWRQAQRLLTEALRLGAFSVLDRPVQLEQLLAAFQRLMDRRYHGHWPGHPS